MENAEKPRARAVDVETRDLPCNLCGSQDLRLVYKNELEGCAPPVDYDFSSETRKTFQIVRCSSCGLLFTNPMPKMGSFYTNTVDTVYLNSRRQREVTALHAVEEIAKLKPEGRLLDVGCAIGIFLDAAGRHYAVEGIELSSWAADIAAQRHKVHRRPAGELDLKGRFDVITLWGVIEHFENPREEIRILHEALTPGGLLVVYTGDLAAWLPRLLGKKWWWFQGMHLFYFSRETLGRMLREAGFDILGRKSHRIYFQLFSLATSLNRYWITAPLRMLLNLPWIRDLMIPLEISGEMVLYARKRAS